MTAQQHMNGNTLYATQRAISNLKWIESHMDESFIENNK